MHLAFVTADAEVPVFGSRGCSVHVQEILRAFVRKKHTVDLFAACHGGPVSAEFASLKMPSIAPGKAATPAERERAAIAVNNTLRDLLAARHREQPFSAIYERYSLWSHAAMEFAREINVPGILEVNAPLLEEVTRQHLLLHRAAAEDASMRAFRSATVITTVSQQLGHIIEQHPSARGKVQVVPNAADPRRFSSVTATLPRKPEEFVIGFTGELRPWQGLVALISAFALVADAYPGARLLIIGEGPEREALEREVAAKNLQQHVHFAGAVPAHAVPGYLASIDVAVAPYPQLSGFYGSPLKIFEYMAAGLPIVASRIGQIRDILTHDRTALLVEPGNREELAETLYSLAEDEEKRIKLGLAAKSRLTASHTWDATLERVFSLAQVQV